MNVNHIGSKIRAFRKARGMNQTQLARKINVDPSHISKLESNQTRGSLTTLSKIAAALGVSITDLLEEDTRSTGTG